VHFPTSISLYGVFLLAAIGLGLAWLALRNGSKKPESTIRGSLHRDLDHLFSDISRGLRSLSTPARFGSMGLMRENQAEVKRKLSELQRRLRMLEDGARDKYEARAHRILAQAARFGITLPPP
jgi:hypothetical protein